MIVILVSAVVFALIGAGLGVGLSALFMLAMDGGTSRVNPSMMQAGVGAAIGFCFISGFWVMRLSTIGRNAVGGSSVVFAVLSTLGWCASQGMNYFGGKNPELDNWITSFGSGPVLAFFLLMIGVFLPVGVVIAIGVLSAKDPVIGPPWDGLLLMGATLVYAFFILACVQYPEVIGRAALISFGWLLLVGCVDFLSHLDEDIK